jgi:chromate transporter
MNLFLIYAEFFKIGIFAVGGGLAALPFLFQIADGRAAFIPEADWLTREMVANFLAIAQCSPGAIGVNVAAQTGFQYGGIAGGFFAALGLISPAIAVIAITARVLQAFKKSAIAASVFSGLRPAAAGILCAAGFGAWKLALYDSAGSSFFDMIRWRECLIFAALFLLIVTGKKRPVIGHPVVCIALGAVAGVALGL